MMTNRNGHGFFATEFKRAASESDKIQVTRHEIKHILDEYDSVKTTGLLHPVSAGIKNIKALYEHLSKDECLLDEELLQLTHILINIKNNSGSKTHSVVKNLVDKLKQPIRFIEKFNLYFSIKETFPIICQKPSIVDDIEIIIKECGCRDMLKQLIIQYPNALPIISKAIKTKKFSNDLLTPSFWPTIFDNNKQEYAIDIASAFEELRMMDRIIYHQPEVKADNSNLEANKSYKATLCSDKNMQIIVKHGEFAADITWLYIALHHGCIGKDNLNNAEASIGNAINKDSSCANQLRRAFEKLHEQKLLNEAHASYLLLICQNANVAEKLASTLIALKNDQILNLDNFNFILSHVQISNELHTIMHCLKHSFLLETPGILNVLYQHAPRIDVDVVTVIQNLFEARLLNKINFFALFENYMHLKSISQELKNESISQEQLDAIIAKVKIKNVSEEKKAEIPDKTASQKAEVKESKISDTSAKIELNSVPEMKESVAKLNTVESKNQDMSLNSLSQLKKKVDDLEARAFYDRLRRI